MTRKDYSAFAEMFATCQPPRTLNNGPINRIADATWQHAARACADIFARDNPRFDRKRFMKACARKEE